MCAKTNNIKITQLVKHSQIVTTGDLNKQHHIGGKEEVD